MRSSVSFRGVGVLSNAVVDQIAGKVTNLVFPDLGECDRGAHVGESVA